MNRLLNQNFPHRPAFPRPSGRRCLWLALLLTACCVGPLFAQKQFTAEFSNNPILYGDSTVLSLTFEGNAPQERPPEPVIEGARVYFQGRSTRWSSVNGQTSLETAFNYLVTPVKAGELTLNPLTLRSGNQELVSNAATLRVMTQDQAEEFAEEQEKRLAFVQVEVPKEELYVGEVVAAEIRVYGLSSINNLQLHQFKADGFTLGQAGNTIPTRVTVDGRNYQMFTFRVPVAPRRSGTLNLGPAECTLDVVLNNTSPTDPFQQPNRFSRQQVRSLRVRSEAVEMRVLPLPEAGKPDTFNGAVGQFSMQVTAGPTNVVVGDPITYTVTLHAQGTLDDLMLPEQASWREFKIYPATSEVIRRDGTGLSGVKKFEQIVVPMNAEVDALPPFQFSFFNPETRSYRTLTHPAVPLDVQPNTSSTPASAFMSAAPKAQESEPEQPEFRHIKPRLGLVHTGGLLVQRPWFVLLNLLPVLAWAGMHIRRRYRVALENNPRRKREKETAQLIHRKLGTLPGLAREGDRPAFYETVMVILREQLGERLNLPSASITEDVLDDRLPEKGVDTETLKRLHALYARCNQARYAGHATSEELHALIPEIEQLVGELRKLPNP